MHRFLVELYLALWSWIPTGIGRKLRGLFLRPLFRKAGRCSFATGVILAGPENMSLGTDISIMDRCGLYAQNGSLSIDDNLSMNVGSILSANNGTIHVGKNVSIGYYSVLRAADHIFDKKDIPIQKQGHAPGTIVVEDDVWIAAHCTITPNVRIGKGAIVAAGAVVTTDVAPYTIVGGVPARFIKHR